MSLIKYPYTNLHELNLDWIIEQLNNQDGPVRSVNGKSGIVTLTGEDIVRSSSNPETVATALNTQGTSIQTVRNQIGVTPLPTTAQTLTGAIAENAQEIADLEDNVIGSTELPTEAQTLTGAIAENADNIGGNAESITTINNKIGNTALPTTAQTLTGAIAELNTQLANTNITSPQLLNATNDMDNVRPGYYYQRYGSSAMPSNAPASQFNAYCVVYAAGESGVVQEWFSMNTGKKWRRYKASSSDAWTAWTEI